MLHEVEDFEPKTMDEIMIEGTGRTLYDYAYGYCAYFGIALHEKYDALINVMWGKYEGIWSLSHVYCTKNGKMKDASGNIDESVLDDYRSFFDYEEFKVEILSKEELLNKLADLGADKTEILKDVELIHVYLNQEEVFYDF